MEKKLSHMAVQAFVFFHKNFVPSLCAGFNG